MLEYGAEINCVVQNQTPLHIACSRGNSMMTKWLLEHRANPNITINSGATPLMFASKYSHPECIVLLLKYDAKINKTDVSYLIIIIYIYIFIIIIFYYHNLSLF